MRADFSARQSTDKPLQTQLPAKFLQGFVSVVAFHLQNAVIYRYVNSLFCKGDPKKQKCFLGIRSRSGAKKAFRHFYGMRKAELAMTRLARVSRTLAVC